MMTPQERKAYDAAIAAAHAFRKYRLSIDAAIDEWDQGKADTPQNSKRIDDYGQKAHELSEAAIELNDELAGHSVG